MELIPGHPCRQSCTTRLTRRQTRPTCPRNMNKTGDRAPLPQVCHDILNIACRIRRHRPPVLGIQPHRPASPNVALRWGDLGGSRTNSCRSRPPNSVKSPRISVRMDPKWSQSWPTSAKVGPVSANFGHVRPTFADFDRFVLGSKNSACILEFAHPSLLGDGSTNIDYRMCSEDAQTLLPRGERRRRRLRRV